ncbi:MAG: hypothetical protein AAF600_13435 [Bacteroidota bacterium]
MAISIYKKWFLLGGLSVSLIGAGLCMVIESAFLKHENPESNLWIFYGTGSLIVFNAGICIFGVAVITRMKLLRDAI